MVGEKIYLLWRQSLASPFYGSPKVIWLLIYLHVRRFYYALITTSAFVVPGIVSFFYQPYMEFFWFFLLIYLVRPSVGNKDFTYVRRFFELEQLVPLLSMLLFLTGVVNFLPLFLKPCSLLLAACVAVCMYDQNGTIPDRLFKTMRAAGAIIFYGLPFFILASMVLCLWHYFFIYSVIYLVNVWVVYPLVGALVTLHYVHVLHENYEVYYVE